MAFGIVKATTVSIFVESVLYGFFLFLFLLAASIIWRRHRECPITRGINMKMLCILVTMFLTATIHLGTSLSRVLDAFIDSDGLDGNSGTIAQKLNAIDTPAYVLRIAMYCVQTLVGDAFILYRLHLVWNGNKFVFYPLVMTFFGSFATAVGALQNAARSHGPAISNPIFKPKQGAWVVSFVLLTLVTNASATALIAGRIWWVPLRITQMANGASHHKFGPASIAIMGSGAIYSISLILLIVFFLKGSDAQTVVVDSMTQVIGIVFSLVIVRVALGVSRGGAIKPQRGMHAEQLNLSVMSEPTFATETWQSRSTHMLKQGQQSDFISCEVEVEVIQSHDTASVGENMKLEHAHVLVHHGGDCS